jgi:ubiquinone/menaquinone biosynthesis C-methylase UbiE
MAGRHKWLLTCEPGPPADVGCGIGYFSLKISPKVAEHRRVLAEDILSESLTFLWIRAFLHHQSNIRVIHGDPDDPHLPKGAVDAVLIANSYHEFTNPLAILDHTFRALRSDGRLVDLGHITESPVKSRCSNTKSHLR